ncbi:hypothetical protein E3P99_02477 [Wallemia hederae]|uniref:Small ribosomal subunit protein mS38 n=1 Tax=Wallemia hederae TaxID=1540922 RepID=A0A4T0FK16_9BASI|nr:hypothetical protein E3P99_02477 [Wallemia hederae]
MLSLNRASRGIARLPNQFMSIRSQSSIHSLDRTLYLKQQPHDSAFKGIENKQNLAYESFVAGHRPLFISDPVTSPAPASVDSHKLSDEQVDSILDDIDCALFKVKITEVADHRNAMAKIGLGERIHIDLDSVKRKRKKKMNKHKYRKRRKAQRAERKRLGK